MLNYRVDIGPVLSSGVCVREFTYVYKKTKRFVLLLLLLLLLLLSPLLLFYLPPTRHSPSNQPPFATEKGKRKQKI